MKYRTAVCILAALVAFVLSMPIVAGEGPSADSQERLAQLAQANIIGVHAFEILLAQKAGKGDPACWAPGALAAAGLEALVAHQAALLTDDTGEIQAWVDGKPSTFDPSRDLMPLLDAPLVLADALPVNVFIAYLSDAAPAAAKSDVLAIANLYQTSFEVDRDGAILWDLMFFYRALGYRTYVGQLGLPGSDADFLAVGAKLAPLTCVSPFDVDPAAWQIAGRKIWNWGEKYGHVRDNFTIARELLNEPDVRVLIPRIRALAPEKIAVIGHSFTMQSHWATPGVFPAIVSAIFEMENPNVITRQWFGGGLNATRAYNNFYKEALAWQPDIVFFGFGVRGDSEAALVREMTRGFTDAGARVYAFDTMRDPSANARRIARPAAPAAPAAPADVNAAPAPAANAVPAAAATAPAPQPEPAADEGPNPTPIEVGALLAASPDKDSFLCLDHIHMTEGYHRLLAKEWLKFLVGARDAKLPEAQ